MCQISISVDKITIEFLSKWTDVEKNEYDRRQMPKECKLCTVSFDNWKDAVERFSKHEIYEYHKESIENAEGLVDFISGINEGIHVQLENEKKRQILDNRKKLATMIETVIFCGRQDLLLRGHRDAGPINDVFEELDDNDGNFRALLRYRGRHDNDLKKMLENSNENALYISPTIQNEIFDACNDVIRNQIVNKVNALSCFVIIADETQDIACIEQFSLCFVPLLDMTGRGIAQIILDNLRSFGVDISKARGQVYDGAAAINGKFNGVQAAIRETLPLALYVHCAPHCLNLAVSDACNVSLIRNCMGTVQKRERSRSLSATARSASRVLFREPARQDLAEPGPSSRPDPVFTPVMPEPSFSLDPPYV
ncbi:zinc finger MYM-type protein 1-like [Belonocnema kinseyi]|uniref:zinc finger MYM-type protein 1-like n=1 Tax=Belonocnema kinseyi TaxID=2817044 RepID=UPI00143DD74C|nr:zinc finger MYM-type protein 1-like [Belonocnema kinseyi]